MRWRHSLGHIAVLAALVSAAPAAARIDPANPTCPEALGWAAFPVMRFTLDKSSGSRILRAEGLIDDGAATRLAAALATHSPVEEIRLSSPGGNARCKGALEWPKIATRSAPGRNDRPLIETIAGTGPGIPDEAFSSGDQLSSRQHDERKSDSERLNAPKKWIRSRSSGE